MTELFGVADGVLPSVLLLEPGVDTDPFIFDADREAELGAPDP